MEFFTELKQLLQTTQSPDSATRKAAELEIRNLRDKDPVKFIFTLTKEIADASNPEEVRLMAAVIFKNFIANRGNDPRYEDIWIKLDGTHK